MDHGGFPSDETLSAFVDGALDAETRARVVDHLASCAECYATVVAVMDTQRALHGEARPAPKPRRARLRRGRQRILLAVASLAAAAALAVLLAATVFHEQVDRILGRSGTAALAAAAPEDRNTAARLAGFPYRPLRRARRGGSTATDASKRANFKFLVAAARAEEAAKAKPNARNLHALGVSFLVSGSWDAAVTTLEGVVRSSAKTANLQQAIGATGDTTLLVDLTAAYLARAEAFPAGAARDRLFAIDAAERAWALDPTSPEVAWNRATAMEAMNLRDDAIRAWQTYLQLDPQSPWAAEARQNLAELQKPTVSKLWQRDRDALRRSNEPNETYDLVTRYAQQSRAMVEEELLPEWAAAFLAHDAEAGARALRVAHAVAHALGRVSGDVMTGDAVAAIEAAERRGDTHALTELANAHVAFAEGRAAYRAERKNDAAVAYTRAEQGFTAGGSPFALWSAFERATCRFARNDYAGSDAALEALRAKPPLREGRYLALAARIDWVLALAEDNLGHPRRAFDLKSGALERFTKLREIDNVAALHTMLADLLHRLGEDDAALLHHSQAMELLAESGSTGRRHQILFEAAVFAVEQQHFGAGEVLLARLEEQERHSDDAVDACMTSMWTAVLHGRDGSTVRSREEVDRASRICTAIGDADLRERALAQLTLAAAAVPNAGGRSIPSLTNAIRFYETKASHLWLAQLYGERGAAYRRTRQLDLAASDFQRGIVEVERAAMRVGDGASVDSLAGENLYADMLQVQAAKGDAATALAYAERAAARRISGLYAPAAGVRDVFRDDVGDVPVEALRAQLPADTVVVEYALAGPQLFTWIVARDRFSMLRTPLGGQSLDALTDAFTASVRDGGDGPAVQRAGWRVSQLLLGDWIATIPSGRTLVFVAGSGVDPVPFAALPQPRNGRFLIEDYSVGTAGGLARFVRANADDAQRRLAAGRALFLAPSTEPYDPLRYASREIELASRAWPAPARLDAATATKAMFLRLAHDAVVIHFAGHGLPNEKSPLLSALLFTHTPKDRDGGLLYLHELSPEEFGHVRLFVLAACSTGKMLKPEMSFASALTAQRVPSVVGALWDADDRATSELFGVFHHELRRGVSRAASLRSAQLSLLRGPDAELRRPAAWAAFQLTGAVSPLFEEERENG